MTLHLRILVISSLLVAAAGIGLMDLETDLLAQEDTIVYCLIERLRFKRNWPAYQNSIAVLPAEHGSLAEFVIRETEIVEAKAGRYVDEDEELPFLSDQSTLAPPPFYKKDSNLSGYGSGANLNTKAWNFYFNEFLPFFAVRGDDFSYIPAITADLNLLQAFSRRIHFGKQLAENKYSAKPADFDTAIRNKDEAWLWKLVANEDEDYEIKERVKKKVWIFGENVRSNSGYELKKNIDPSKFETFFAKGVIPLTRQVEVKYLLGRLNTF